MNYTVVSYFDVLDLDWETHFRWNSQSTKRKDKFIKGALYRLRQNKKNIDSSISFQPVEDKLYRLKGIVHQIHGTKFESVIMKQVSGPTDHHIYSLSKHQCHILHTKFESGLEMFNMSNKFQRVIEKFKNDKSVVLNPNNLETYPHCVTDGTIRTILVRLDDLVYNDNFTKIIHKKTKKKYNLVENDNFNPNSIGGINIKSKRYIKTPNGRIIYKPNEQVLYDYLPIDSLKPDDHNVYIEVIFKIVSEGIFTEDGSIGIKKSDFRNKTLNDFIEIIDIKEKK